MSEYKNFEDLTEPVVIVELEKLEDRQPAHAQVLGTDLVVIKYDEDISVLYGRCLHRGALLSDGHIRGHNLICGLHNWDYRMDSGVSEYAPNERLHKFIPAVSDGKLYLDKKDVEEFEEKQIPSPFYEDEYLGKFADTHPEDTEPYTRYIQSLARDGLKVYGHHGPTEAMGVGPEFASTMEGHPGFTGPVKQKTPS